MTNTVNRELLPGLNYLSSLVGDDFEFSDDVTVQELLNRFKAIYGADFSSLNNYGIISDADPASAPSTDSALAVSLASTSDPFTYAIQPGSAVTPSGQMIIVPARSYVSIPQVDGNVYCILAKYVLIPTTPRLKLNVYINARREVDTSSQLEVVLLGEYLLRPASALASSVVIGVIGVAVDPTTSTLSTTLDSTRASYSFNRPWFSPVDYFHRNQLGNPHKTQMEDLDQGGIPLMMKFRNDGFLIAEDAQYPYFPGHLCVENVPRDAITGGNYPSYVLSRRPVRLGRLYDAETPGIEYPYYYNLILNRITLLAQPPLHKDLKLDMLVVDSFEPSLLTQVARFGDISASGEAAISQGNPIRTMSSFDVPLNDFGPGDHQLCRVYAMADGTLVRTPKTLLCQGKVGSDLPVDEDIPLAVTMPLPGVPRIIVKDNVAFSGSVVLTGTDVNGSPHQESISFAFDPAYPNGVVPSPGFGNFVENDTTQFGLLTPADTGGCVLPPEMARQKRLVTQSACPCRYAASIFGSITSIRLENISGGSREGSITLQVLLDTRSLLYLAEIVESNGVPQTLVDNRAIISGLNQVDRGIDAALSIANASLPVVEHDTTYIENFTEPKFGDFRSSTLFDPSRLTGFHVTGRHEGSEQMFYCSKILPVSYIRRSPVEGSIQILSTPFLDQGMVDFDNTDLFISLEFFFVDSSGISAPVVHTRNLYNAYSYSFSVALTPLSTINAVRVKISGKNMRGFVIHVHSQPIVI